MLKLAFQERLPYHRETGFRTPKTAIPFKVYRIKGDAKQKRLTIGKYPEVSLLDAGELVVKYRGQAAKGNDPSVKRKAKMEKKRLERENIALRDRDTVNTIDEWYYKECIARR